MARRFLIVALLSLTLLSACGGGAWTWEQQRGGAQPVPANDRYTVRGGDTLYSIAFRFGLSHRELARWNGLSDATLIYPGQVLRLTRPSSVTAAGAASASRPAPRRRPAVVEVSGWGWPTKGRVVSTYDVSGQVSRTGILISGQRGQPIVASAAGDVVYSGSGLKGYGKLVIIQHNASYLSAYGHNAALLVAEGDKVTAGQTIATMGETAAQRPRLHFEIRRNGDPIDPLPLLPR